MRDVLTCGIADPEIQLDILNYVNQDRSLEEEFKFIEAKEAGKRSAVRLSSQGAEAAKSSYRKEKRDSQNLMISADIVAKGSWQKCITWNSKEVLSSF